MPRKPAALKKSDKILYPSNDFMGLTSTIEHIPEYLYGRSIGANTRVKGATVGDFADPKNLGAGTYALLRNPYTAAMTIRFEEAWRLDPVIRSAINRKVAYSLGKRFHSVFQLVDDFPNKKLASAALSEFASKQEWQNAKKIIDRLNKKLDWQQKLKAATIQSKVYGRAGLLLDGPVMKDGFPERQLTLDDIPGIDMKILSSKLMGLIRIDENTWDLQAVLYNTNNRGLNDPSNYILANNLIYFTNVDYHVSPFTVRYGYSDIEPVAHVSECNRIMNELDFKEINFSMWAGFGLIKVPGTRNVTDVQNFLAQFKAGKWSVISSDLEVQVHNLTSDLGNLIKERRENEQLILRAMNVPSLILGFEDVANFATAQEVMIAWRESVLEEERTWIKDTVGPQWYDRLLANILQIDVYKLDALITLEFEDIALEDAKSKALYVLPLFEAGLINGERVLTAFGFDDAIDDYHEMQQQKQKAQDEMNKRMKEQGGTPQQPPDTIPDISLPSSGGRSILTKIDKISDTGQQPSESTAAEEKLL